MYAHYLAKRGFNLILIERDMNQLQLLEVNLQTELLDRIKITKIVIDKFDQDSMWKALHNAQVSAHTDVSPVKVFVNCKNSKRKAVTAEVEKFQLNDSMLGESIMMDESVMREDQRETLK